MKTISRLYRHKLSRYILLALAGLALALPAWAGWPKLTPAERQFTAPPVAPGAAAVILEKTVYCDNVKNTIRRFFRIKILRSAGLEWATVKVPYIDNSMKISHVEGRTVEPDGTIVPFQGNVWRAVMVKIGDEKIKAMEFDLPQARVGSILDYRYTIALRGGGLQDNGGYFVETILLPNTTWHLQSDLFVRREDYTLLANHSYNLHLLMIGLTPQQRPKRVGALYTLELKDVTPSPNEPFSLPAVDVLKSVRFLYSTHSFGLESARVYWRELAKQYAYAARHFIGNPKDLRRWLVGVNLSGTPEQKLRAIYARVLQIKNLYLGAHVVSPRQNHSVKDVLKHGYGYGTELNLTLIGLARAAGIPAWWVHSGRRNAMRFIRSWPDSDQLNNDLVMVQLGTKPVFLDPEAGCPYGVLLWYEDHVTGLVANHKGGQFVSVPFQLPRAAMRERRLDLHWQGGAAPGWQGTLTVQFHGLLAMQWGDRWRTRDAAGRQKALDQLARNWLPASARLKNTSSHGWQVGAPLLSAVWQVTLPASSPSTFWPQDILNARHPPVLVAENRLEPIYFHYPYLNQDTIRLLLPPGVSARNLPPATIIPNPPNSKAGLVFVERAALQHASQGDMLTIHRRMQLNMELVPVIYYAPLKNLFSVMTQTDRQRIVLAGQPTAALQKQ